MDYEGRICRAPQERGAFMLPVMVGCTYNKCKFCGLFKHLDFRVLPLDEVEAEIGRVANLGGNPEIVFLGDGNAFCLPTDHLLKIANMLSNNFSNLRQINMDATVSNILAKSDDELKEIAAAKIYNLYVGIESGLEDVLDFMNKGNTLEEAAAAISKLHDCGMVYSAHIMSGIAGEGRGQENAKALARFLNENPPLNICNFDLGMHRSVELWDDFESGRYKVSCAKERLLETRTLIEQLSSDNKVNYDGVFEVPPVRFIGTLPKDREKLISQIDDTLSKYRDIDEQFCIWD